jgi:hypothetical protein
MDEVSAGFRAARKRGGSNTSASTHRGKFRIFRNAFPKMNSTSAELSPRSSYFRVHLCTQELAHDVLRHPPTANDFRLKTHVRKIVALRRAKWKKETRIAHTASSTAHMHLLWERTQMGEKTDPVSQVSTGIQVAGLVSLQAR